MSSLSSLILNQEKQWLNGYVNNFTVDGILDAQSAVITSLTINNVYVSTATVGHLSVSTENIGTSTINYLLATTASIGYLSATTASIGYLTAGTATMNAQFSTTSTINNLYSTTATILYLNANTITASNITSASMTLQNLYVIGTATFAGPVYELVTVTSTNAEFQNLIVSVQATIASENVTTSTITNLNVSSNATISSLSANTLTVGYLNVTSTATMTNLWATTTTLSLLNVQTVTVGYLNVTNTATLTNLWATTATLSSLNVQAVTVGYLNVTNTATMTNLWATTATLSVLNIGTETVSYLNATTASISNLTAGTMTVTTLALNTLTIGYLNVTSTATMTNLYANTATLNHISGGTVTISALNVLVSITATMIGSATSFIAYSPNSTLYGTSQALVRGGLVIIDDGGTSLGINIQPTGNVNLNCSGVTTSAPLFTDSMRNLTSTAPTTVTFSVIEATNITSSVSNIGTETVSYFNATTASISNLTVGTMTLTALALNTLTIGYLNVTNTATMTNLYATTSTMSTNYISGQENVIGGVYTNSIVGYTTTMPLQLASKASYIQLSAVSISASQALVTDASVNMISLAYTPLPTATTIMSRDQYANVYANSFQSVGSTVTMAGATVTLSVSSAQYLVLQGSFGNLVLPDATTLTYGSRFWINNNATGTVTLDNNSGSSVYTILPGAFIFATNVGTGSPSGTWDVHSSAPGNIQWGTNGINTLTIGYLNVTNTATMTNLFATTQTVGYLNVTSTATMTNLFATTQTVGYLNVTSTATMTNLFATAATMSILNVSTITGTTTINNGLIFQNSTASYTPTTFNYYEENVNVSAVFSGAWTQTITVAISRSGGANGDVNITLADMSNNSPAGAVQASGGIIPTRFRPTANKWFVIWGENNSAVGTLVLEVTTAGTISIGPTTSGNGTIQAFTASAAAHIFSSRVGYNLGV